MNQVMNHPFLTGKAPSRMIGEEPEFDVFLSYRLFFCIHFLLVIIIILL